MIQGLQIDVKGSELKTMFENRLKYHADKATALQGNLEKLSDIEKTMDAEAESIGKFSNASPRSSLETTIKKHKDQTIYYKFMVDHVVVDETYRLAEADLYKLGIQERTYLHVEQQEEVQVE